MTSKPNQQPKDLDVKIGSKIEARWTTVRDKAKADIEELEMSIIINEAVIAQADTIIAEEKEKFK